MDSQADFDATVEHESNWAVFPLVRLRPEQVAGGVIQACSLKTINADSHIFTKIARYFQQNDFVTRYGDTGEDEFGERAGTITQRLLMLNGKLVNEKTSDGQFVASNRVSAFAPDDEVAVETVYLTVLTRRPTAEEREHFIRRLDEAKQTKRTQCIEDMYWSLLNSTEFSWNH